MAHSEISARPSRDRNERDHDSARRRRKSTHRIIARQPSEPRLRRQSSRYRDFAESWSHEDLDAKNMAQPTIEEESQPEDEFERPIDANALREARLSAMETPPTMRKRMKVEYEQSPAVKQSAPVSTRRSAKSVVSTTTRTSFWGGTVVSTKKKEPEKKRREKRVSEDEGDYVYARPERRQSQSADRAQAELPRARTSDKRRTSEDVHRIKVRRRQTEPLPQTRRDSIVEATRSRPRHSEANTSTTKSKRLDQNSSAAQRPSTIRSSTQSTTPSSSKNRPSSSSFFSLFNSAPPQKPAVRKVSCLPCGDLFLPSQTALLPCRHRMCHACLTRLFKLSLKDPAHMPPKCCSADEISLHHVNKLFDDNFKKSWNRKYKEYNTRNKIYCVKRGCGEWIQLKHMRIDSATGRRIGVCAQCKTKTCALCNGRAHRTKECPKDATVNEFLEQAEQQGWKRCYRCKAMVELKEGCNHMTCRCTAEFCMVCGRKWKTCECPWFNFEGANVEGEGDPIRNAREFERRREMERADEEIARGLAGLRVDGENGEGGGAGRGGRWGPFGYFQQARDAIVPVPLQQAPAPAAAPAAAQAANGAGRGLFWGWLGRQSGAMPPANTQSELQPQPGPEPEPEPVNEVAAPVRARPQRRRTTRG